VIKHYLHIYADGTGWPEALAEHMDAVTGIEFDEVNVGIVGHRACRDAVKMCLPPGWTVVAEADEGWEQVTLQSIVCDPDDIICYTHTKGAANDTLVNRRWRHHLEKRMFDTWRTCVHALQSGADIVCPSWLTESVVESDLPEGCHGFTPVNFWWARGSYLHTLPAIETGTRYDAETWIGMGEKLKVRALTVPTDGWMDWAYEDEEMMRL
jgi:hypothetical protein